MIKYFAEEQTSVSGDSQKQEKRSALKQRVVTIINTVYERLLKRIIPGTEIEVLLLQYGSAFFEADDTDESDFDILMVTKYSEIEKFMQKEYRSHVFEVAEMRSQFFFGKFFAELVTEPEV